MAPALPFSVAWDRIKRHAGLTFYLKKGDPFKYQMVNDDSMNVDRVSQDFFLTKSDFNKAYQLVPFNGPGVIQNACRGPSYIWAILHDARIRQSDW